MSQVELAQAMSNLGHNWSQSQVTKSETGSRPVSVAEVVALGHCLGVVPQVLLGMSATEDADAQLVRYQIRRAKDQLTTLVEEVEFAQEHLEELQRRLEALEAKKERGR